MLASVCTPQKAVLPQQQQTLPDAAAHDEEPRYPPLNFFYKHLHDSIRTELETLAALVCVCACCVHRPSSCVCEGASEWEREQSEWD